ncbi:MAG TPA: hypothetical protein VIX87_13285 [Steroidobacteraceae bacterium]
MPLHQAIQRLLLIGARLPLPAPPAAPRPPPQLLPLIDSLASAHDRFDAIAIHYGHRYRSGFWSIYLLSAVAVLFAILPLALGWDSSRHAQHPYSGLWALGEVAIIVTVSTIYWLGIRRDWQGQWLRARTTAELTWYLPLLAPLLDFAQPASEPNWYLRVLDPGQHLRGADEVAALCARHEALARTLVERAWDDPAFGSGYARWMIDILAGQIHYHHGIAVRQHALLHRVHALNIGLFGFTALGALIHLMLHTLWLSLITTFFPALGAGLHGALAQSEAYRLGATSERLVVDLRGTIARIELTLNNHAGPADAGALRTSIEAALALILEEHQDWHMLVRPHQMPLA